jgi:hypothetical protein
MAQMASGSDSSRTYSYTRTETYTFEEAIQKAINGSLDPSEIYRQGQSQLKKVINSISKQVFSKQFSDLTTSQQREIMKKLLWEIENEKEQSKKPVTMLDALKMAKDGLIDDLELYDNLPNELREVLDTISHTYNVLSFKIANPELRKEILVFIIELIAKDAEDDSLRQKQKEAEQQAQKEAKLKEERESKIRRDSDAKFKADMEAKLMEVLGSKHKADMKAKIRKEEEARQSEEKAAKIRKEEEIKRKNMIELNRKNAKQCIICGNPLGFFDKLSHRESHRKCKK